MARPISRETAIRRIKSFTKKYTGKSILFSSLSEQEKHTYIMVKQYNYFRNFLSVEESLKRTINNANIHRKSGYDVYSNPMEHMIIGG